MSACIDNIPKLLTGLSLVFKIWVLEMIVFGGHNIWKERTLNLDNTSKVCLRHRSCRSSDLLCGHNVSISLQNLISTPCRALTSVEVCWHRVHPGFINVKLIDFDRIERLKSIITYVNSKSRTCSPSPSNSSLGLGPFPGFILAQPPCSSANCPGLAKIFRFLKSTFFAGSFVLFLELFIFFLETIELTVFLIQLFFALFKLLP